MRPLVEIRLAGLDELARESPPPVPPARLTSCAAAASRAAGFGTGSDAASSSARVSSATSSGSTSTPASGGTNSGGPPIARRDDVPAARERLRAAPGRTARAATARRRRRPRRASPARRREELGRRLARPRAALEAAAQRPVADEGERAAAERRERIGEADDVLALGERADADERRPRAAPRRAAASANRVEVDARVDDLGLAARLRQLLLELAPQVVRDRDHGRGAPHDPPRQRGDARKRADVPNVAAVRGDDERRVDLAREQARRDEEVRPHDIGARRRAHRLAQLEEPPLAAGAAVEHGQVDLVAALPQRPLAERDERRRGRGRPGPGYICETSRIRMS